MKIPKLKPFVCTCGRIIIEISAGARFSDDPDLGGWYFECRHCHTTVYIKPGSSRLVAEVARGAG